MLNHFSTNAANSGALANICSAFAARSADRAFPPVFRRVFESNIVHFTSKQVSSRTVRKPVFVCNRWNSPFGGVVRGRPVVHRPRRGCSMEPQDSAWGRPSHRIQSREAAKATVAVSRLEEPMLTNPKAEAWGYPLTQLRC